ncbi:nitrate ABC transporter substrate-binding protein [Acinetobacter proteolyticus]|uniref:ABC transporter substrate-binding protein n=1 Tax=Acinetobacter proteolyticus TaxID=1776741 RepID=UPI0008631C49|nr:ABC transporter substrate-binding protein [Acinetobacter proteolyticus]OEY92856.1 nitrate ABC transporter substrate-binding protein [Acinetobacter proteolyticus]QHH92552.1 nitrate ABC transporter substrate-binding protein [Acinetobacter gyllenbergii]
MRLNHLAQSLILSSSLLTIFSSAHAENIRIAIGTQDTTINCATGGLLIRELNLLPKYLPKTGKYKDAKYDIVWKNFTSGAPLTSEMVAGRLDIGAMADFPAVNNNVAFKKTGKESIFLSVLSGSTTGSGNGIVVPLDSDVNSIQDLKGKTISVPFASTAHGLLLRAVAAQGWDPKKDVKIIAQAPEVAGPALKSNKVDAHADFVPFAELFPYQGFARKIYDGAQAKTPTFHGSLASKAYAQQYPEIIQAYLRATIEADQLIRKQPEKYSELIAAKTGIPAEVVYLFHGPLGVQTRDLTWKPEYKRATQTAVDTLKYLGRDDVDLNVNQFIDEQYIKKAFQSAGLNYAQQLKNYAQSPLVAKDALTQKPIQSFDRVTQIWVKGEAQVRSYATPETAFADLNKLKQSGKNIRVVYNQDRNLKIKLLANLAWYATDKNGQISAFLLRGDANNWAKAHGGKVYDFNNVQKLVK